MGKPKSKVEVVRVRGPLAQYAAAFEEALEAAGYTPLSTASVMRAVSNLSIWLEEQTLEAADLDADRIEEFIRYRRSAGFVAPPPLQTLKGMSEDRRGVRDGDRQSAHGSGIGDGGSPLVVPDVPARRAGAGNVHGRCLCTPGATVLGGPTWKRMHCRPACEGRHRRRAAGVDHMVGGSDAVLRGRCALVPPLLLR